MLVGEGVEEEEKERRSQEAGEAEERSEKEQRAMPSDAEWRMKELIMIAVITVMVVVTTTMMVDRPENWGRRRRMCWLSKIRTRKASIQATALRDFSWHCSYLRSLYRNGIASVPCPPRPPPPPPGAVFALSLLHAIRSFDRSSFNPMLHLARPSPWHNRNCTSLHTITTFTISLFTHHPHVSPHIAHDHSRCTIHFTNPPHTPPPTPPHFPCCTAAVPGPVPVGDRSDDESSCRMRSC